MVEAMRTVNPSRTCCTAHAHMPMQAWLSMLGHVCMQGHADSQSTEDLLHRIFTHYAPTGSRPAIIIISSARVRVKGRGLRDECAEEHGMLGR